MSDPVQELPAGGPPRRLLRTVLVTGSGVLLLVYVLSRIGIPALTRTFAQIGVPALLALIALGTAETVLDGAALWRAVLGRVSLAAALRANAAGALVNLVVPYEAGEVFKGVLLRESARETRMVSGLLVWNYVWKITRPSAGLIAVAFAEAAGHGFDGPLRWLVLGGSALAFAPYLALRLIVHRRPTERLMRLVARLPRLRRSGQSWAEVGATLDAEVSRFWQTHRREFLRVVWSQLGGRVLGALALGLLLWTLGLDLSLGEMAFVYAALAVADLVVLVVPARLGVNEAAGVAMFQLLGLDPAAGLVVGLALRLRALTPQLLFGIPAFFRRR